LPDLHKDPFDRILVAQAQAENMPILSFDRMISQYAVQVIW
jgi:PIN domain nuclease of toxin-antitoxin system